MDNLQKEMKRINSMIQGFYENSLLGESRELIKDTFSEVTSALEAISSDLGQERVALVTSDGTDTNEEGNAAEGAAMPKVT